MNVTFAEPVLPAASVAVSVVAYLPLRRPLAGGASVVLPAATLPRAALTWRVHALALFGLRFGKRERERHAAVPLARLGQLDPSACPLNDGAVRSGAIVGVGLTVGTTTTGAAAVVNVPSAPATATAPPSHARRGPSSVAYQRSDDDEAGERGLHVPALTRFSEPVTGPFVEVGTVQR